MPPPGRRTLSGATAHCLLDGSADGPFPLPQLLAAATAPATAAELQGEETARAAFRSSVHVTPVPLDGSRRARARTATTIVVAKVIAAVALTAGGAGGIAVATNSYSTHLQQNPAVRGTDTATVRDVSPPVTTTSTTVASTQAPDGAAGSGSSTNRGEEAGDGTVASPKPTGRCASLCTTTPADGAARPSGQPEQAAGNKSGKKNTSNGNNSAEETKANNGKKPDKGDSEETTDPGQSKKKDSSNGKNSSDSTQTGAEKGQAKKKKNAGTTPAA